MLADVQIGFMVEQSIEHVGCFMWRPGDDLCPIGVQLIGDVGVEDQAGFRAILGIDLGGVAPWPAHRKALAIRRGGRSISPIGRERQAVMIIDDLSERLGETVVSHIPITDPREACARHARGGIRHLGETQVGGFCEQCGKERFSIFGGFATVQMREMTADVDLLVDLDQ